MIGCLSGKVLHKSPTISIIDCQGVGYEVFHTPFCAELLGDGPVQVLIHTHVREDAFQLFGFVTESERSLFRELLKVSGIGPKMALSILSGIPHEELVVALARKDVSRLQRIPGIGKKTAERLTLELSDRMKTLETANLSGASSKNLSLPKESELESVLLNLGYQRSEVTKAMKAVRDREEGFEAMALEALVKVTLRELTQGRPV